MPTERTDKIIEPNKALKKPSTSNPGVIAPASINNNAFITRENKPNVKKVTGTDINFTKGFINVLIKAITIQASIAFKKLSTLIPGTNQAVKTIINA